MASRGRTPALIPGKAFLHVIDDYRNLARAAFAWNKFGPSGTQIDQDSINALVPGIGVALQESLLLHARSLVDFYTKGASDPTDILLQDFGFSPLSETHRRKLRRYKPSIELHLLHLTAYRDKQFRRANPNTMRPHNPPSSRINWNVSNRVIATEIFECLRLTARQHVAWSKPFQDLYVATMHETTNPGAWPHDLNEAKDVRKYLKRQGFVV